ncbi:DUF6193 family natural product biosynthesis protein [Mucilaginibacter sp. CAU 1740]|uniref:DUF6193 family natural product biosynthesis protein n=1 Tax=Mucilaginibacter sp. CAU 1740 TaxID=3140365 RepID=UPI00325B943F
MNLTIQLQEQLNNLKLRTKLSACDDGHFPAQYAFIRGGERQMRTEFAATNQQYSIVLYERTDKYKHEICFARGIFNSLERLAIVIDLWVDRLKDANEISDQFQELELYKSFSFKNPDPAIDKAWEKVKNMQFNDTEYWKKPEWQARYSEMLNAAKHYGVFKNLYPFTSHYALRFSKDESIRKVWNLFLNIEPSWHTNEKAFRVSYGEKDVEVFDDINDALDFFATKMEEIVPLRYQ